ncbi:DUF4345 domain-containing protein [Pseudomonas aeruginosa]|uniref:DUF4345 domain-containing protein n=5 Tax=Pseudomonas aeruginosa TaxID=287 RepID=UPI0018FE6DE8|nr:DUF4345 domain-containing protein [Pseudomonas aeruginosa]
MTHPLRLLWLCSTLFVVLGLGFVFFPGPLASLLTSGEPLTPAALTDLRASYGGTSFGIGLLLGYAALRPRYLVLGLLAALAVIASGGAARLYGVLIDASPARSAPRRCSACCCWRHSGRPASSTSTERRAAGLKPGPGEPPAAATAPASPAPRPAGARPPPTGRPRPAPA